MSKCPIPWNKTFDKNKKYIWISETGENTCEECKSLDGKIFTGDKVPLRPHPNCKCDAMEYNENEKINNISVGNSEIKELNQNIDNIENLVNVLQGYIKKDVLNNKENSIIENKIKIINNKIELIKNDAISYFKYPTTIFKEKIEQQKKEIFKNLLKIVDDNAQFFKNCLNKETKNINNDFIFGKIKANIYKEAIKQFGYFYANKFNYMPEAYNFFKIGLEEDMDNYIKENAIVYNSVYDLKISEIEKLKIIARISKETPDMSDCKVYSFKEESSIAKKILDSEALEIFFKERKNEIRLFNTTNDSMLYGDLTNDEQIFTMEFKNTDSDLSALCMVF